MQLESASAVRVRLEGRPRRLFLFLEKGLVESDQILLHTFDHLSVHPLTLLFGKFVVFLRNAAKFFFFILEFELFQNCRVTLFVVDFFQEFALQVKLALFKSLHILLDKPTNVKFGLMARHKINSALFSFA